MNSFFEHIFCINLDRRPDKWGQCQAEFSKVGIDVERFPAIDGNLIEPYPHKLPRGAVGNALSEIGVIKLAIERGYKNFLLLEDDVEFAPDFNVKFTEWSKEVPGYWDMLYLGGNHNWRDYIPNFTPHLIKLDNTYATHAFALKDTIYEAVLKGLEPLCPETDVIMASIQKTCQAFSFRPNLAYQRPGISDVHNIYTDYSFFKEL